MKIFIVQSLTTFSFWVDPAASKKCLVVVFLTSLLHKTTRCGQQIDVMSDFSSLNVDQPTSDLASRSISHKNWVMVQVLLFGVHARFPESFHPSAAPKCLLLAAKNISRSFPRTNPFLPSIHPQTGPLSRIYVAGSFAALFFM